MKKYVSYCVEETKNILNVDSPVGYTRNAADFVMEEYKKLGYCPVKTKKGGILVDLGGKDRENAVLLEAHLDTLGAMVAQVKENGRLRLSPLGGMNPNNGEAENCRIITRAGNIYEGTLQMNNASIHVNEELNKIKRSFEQMEVVIDEKTSSRKETEDLGIMTGDIVAFEPRTRVTGSGYIKSRFLDDKLSVGIFLGFAKFLKEEGRIPARHIYQHISVYEEVGHGACGTVPEGTTEILAVDMGCVGEGLRCTEHQVSICAKDSGGPYTYDVVSDLIRAAKKGGADFAVDIYPRYGSDADAALTAGYDVRHGLIGPGVYASHGYERSHLDGVENTLKLLRAYLL
ncbi:MAG: M42 family metallopeptidase [Lachnospiraceae bacterium]|nr:M42 family metallopeptidase [Lachnospiraceae bacterium]